MEKRIVTFKEIDSHNRPIFEYRDPWNNRYYYGSTEKLFSHGSTEEEVLGKVDVNDLVYFGGRLDCEPTCSIPKFKLIIKKQEIENG